MQQQITTTLNIPKQQESEFDLIIYRNPVSILCSDCAYLIKISNPMDIVIKPAFPPWLSLEPWALKLAAEKSIRIVEETDFLDSKMLLFGKINLVISSISDFSKSSKGHTIHMVLPAIWAGLTDLELSGFARSLSKENIRVKIISN